MKKSSAKRIFGVTIPIFFLMWIALMVSSASATRYALDYSYSSSNLQTSSLSITAGTDSTTVCAAYPCASFEGRSKNYAKISLSLFKSQTESPQPQTFYTDLARIKNVGNSSQTIGSIWVEITSGASAIGALTIFYCPVQTKETFALECASFTMNESSTSGSLAGNGALPATLNPGAVGYIEAAGFASASSKDYDQISFQISFSFS